MALLRLFLPLLMFALAGASAEVIRVNKSAGGGAQDGTSWETAYVHLRDALAAANHDDEIWVAQGVYYSDEGESVGPYVHAFSIWKYVKLYGGFDGTETQAEQRDPFANPTILSGDIDQDDLNQDGNRINESDDHIRGTNASNVVLLEGGLDSEFVLDGFVVTGGDAATQTLTGLAGTYGGGLYLRGRPSIITRCRFSGNRSINDGGGVRVAQGTQVFSRCVFAGNRSQTNGGALQSTGPNSLQIHNCLFFDNHATGTGGAFHDSASNVIISNCTVVGNTAGGEGGGMHLLNSVHVYNTIFWDNTSLAGTVASSASLFCRSASATFSHCIIEHSTGAFGQGQGRSLGIDEGGNLDRDPFFLVHPKIGSPNSPGCFVLDSGSPAIDAGANSSVAESLDLTSRTRIFNGTVDIGAFESHGDELDSDDDGLNDAFERAHTTPSSPTGLDPFDDPDLDGLINLQEFAFDLNPLAFDTVPPVTFARLKGGGGDYFSVSYRCSTWAAKYLDILVERSTDLGQFDDWSEGETTVTGRSALSVITTKITEQSNLPIAGLPAEQLRVRVSKK